MCTRNFGESVGASLLLLAFAFGFASFAQCRPQHAETAAEIAYGAALLRCVDNASSLAESKACRAKVNEAWGIVEFAGKDASP